MTTRHTSTATPAAVPGRVQMDNLIAALRDAQSSPELADQRHQFLDIDPDLERDDYTRPARIGGAR
ncbi:hypothetical protein [Streptomyces sp. NPDC056491]|uniref:hypothetical protein n=1 Tax=unclassified Streptomyces TaxID=2593676 RepID=UPI00364A309E